MIDQNEKLMFNVLPWQGVTLVQGNRSFFTAVQSLIADDPQFSDIHSDLGEMLSLTDEFNYADCDYYSTLRFKDLVQLNLTKSLAFSLGEKIEKSITTIDGNKNQINVLFAFCKVLQSAAIGMNINANKRQKRNYY